MLCDHRPASGFSGVQQRRCWSGIRLGALLGLLALVLQVTLPTLHTWQVAAEHTAASWQRPGPLAALQVQADEPALFAVDNTAARAPHNPLLCPVCQVLSRSRDYLSVSAEAESVVAARSWFVVNLVFPVDNVLLEVSIPRAPPAIS